MMPVAQFSRVMPLLGIIKPLDDHFTAPRSSVRRQAARLPTAPAGMLERRLLESGPTAMLLRPLYSNWCEGRPALPAADKKPKTAGLDAVPRPARCPSCGAWSVDGTKTTLQSCLPML